MLAEMPNVLFRLAHCLQDGAVLAVVVGQGLVSLRVFHETHEAVVHGAVNHGSILS